MQSASVWRRIAGKAQSVTSHTLGPYHPWLPVAIRLRLGLGQAGDGSSLGWGVQISTAEVELGYNHVGLEESIALGGLDWPEALAVAEKVCGCCSQANTLAFAQAVESLGQVIVPPRAAYLRLLLAESERIVSHLLNAAEMMQALDLPEREAALRDLRERVIEAIADWSGARLQPSLITYGGVTRNLDEAGARALMLGLRSLERVARQLVAGIVNDREIARRLAGLGVIKAQEALLAGLRGPVARASGVTSDIRMAFPTGAYEDEAVTVVTQRAGDAFSRLAVRLLECLESFRVIEQALDDLPPGIIKARGSLEFREGSAVGRVEGPRGEVFCWVRGDAQGVTGLHLSGGSFPTIGIIPGVLANHLLDDLRPILISLDLCLASVER